MLRYFSSQYHFCICILHLNLTFKFHENSTELDVCWREGGHLEARQIFHFHQIKKNTLIILVVTAPVSKPTTPDCKYLLQAASLPLEGKAEQSSHHSFPSPRNKFSTHQWGKRQELLP